MCSSPYCAHGWPEGGDAVRLPVTNATINFTTSNTYSNGTLERWIRVSSASTTTVSVAAVWDAWVRSDLGRQVQLEEAQRWWMQTDNEVAEQNRRAVAAALEERRAQRAEAIDRAEELLSACLNAKQQNQLETLEAFSVTVASGRTYWIQRGYAGNVRSEGRRYCIHGPMDLPHADQMLMQLLLLQTDEAEFLRVANATPDYEPALIDNVVLAA